MKRVVIVAAKRTPFGRFRGALAELSPVALAVIGGHAALAGIDRTLIDQVILGNVLAAGHGMNVARQVAIKLGLPVETSATTVNMMCGSGMQSALMAVSAIRAGEAKAVLAGGTESMSQSSLLMARPAKGQPPDPATAVDSLQRDGLVDSFSNRHMGEQAEELATDFDLSRETQDAFAARSQHLFGAAQARGDFADEVVAAGKLTVDQHPRPDVTTAELALLQPVFQKPETTGTVTAGNASGINDGAAVLLLAEQEFAESNGWPILAEWIDGVVVGCDPARMGLGPVHAITTLMQRAKRDWASIDTLEINEAFAAQALACLKALKLSLDVSAEDTAVRTVNGHLIAFNREGGAIAIGHPLAASGARLLTHLAWNIARGRSHSAIGALCIGGGMGIAALLTAPQVRQRM
ncbi:MAG: thiolase family protein [Planctomycetaceae bacterium]